MYILFVMDCASVKHLLLLRFLQLVWDYPGENESGNLSCDALGIDSRGHNTVYSTSLVVGVQEPSLSDLVSVCLFYLFASTCFQSSIICFYVLEKGAVFCVFCFFVYCCVDVVVILFFLQKKRREISNVKIVKAQSIQHE